MATVCFGVVAANSRWEQSMISSHRWATLASQRSSHAAAQASTALCGVAMTLGLRAPSGGLALVRNGSRSACSADGRCNGFSWSSRRTNAEARGDSVAERESSSSPRGLPPNAARARAWTGAGRPANNAWARHPTDHRSTAVECAWSPATISGAT